MGQIENLFQIDFKIFMIDLFIIIAGIIAIYKIVVEISVMINKPIGAMKQRKADHELTIANSKAIQELSKRHDEDNNQSIRHDKMIRDDIRTLTDKVDDLSTRLDDMKKKDDATEVAKLKERLLCYYRKYKDLGEWEQFEADVFWELYDSYIARGGNSFVKHDIEPVMRSLRVIN